MMGAPDGSFQMGFPACPLFLSPRTAESLAPAFCDSSGGCSVMAWRWAAAIWMAEAWLSAHMRPFMMRLYRRFAALVAWATSFSFAYSSGQCRSQ